MPLGEKLRKAREAKGWSQVYVSKILGITSQSLSNYERDERDPDTTTLNRLAQMYEVSTDYLLSTNEDDYYRTKEVSFGEVINRIFDEQLLDISQREQLIKKANSLIDLTTPYLAVRNGVIFDNDFIKKIGLKQLGIQTAKDLDTIFSTILLEYCPELAPEAITKQLYLKHIELVVENNLQAWMDFIDRAVDYSITPQELMPILEIIKQSRKNSK